MVELYKDGNNMGIKTDAEDERAFTEGFSAAISELIANSMFVNDWEFQLLHWLPQYADIIGRMRGYKTEVKTATVFTAGQFTADEKSKCVTVNTKGIATVIPSDTVIG